MGGRERRGRREWTEFKMDTMEDKSKVFEDYGHGLQDKSIANFS